MLGPLASAMTQDTWLAIGLAQRFGGGAYNGYSQYTKSNRDNTASNG